MKRDAGAKGRADRVAQLSQRCEFFAADPLRGLHLEHNDVAVIEAQHDIDFVAIAGAPVPQTTPPHSPPPTL